MADRANSSNMEEEGRCVRPREIPRNHTSKSHNEAARGDPGCEDPKKVEQELGEEQQEFRKGRGTTGGMFALRQMVEKRLEMQGRMAVGFVDLEKAYDTVPREMVMATVRWVGVPEAEARMMEAMYEITKVRAVVGFQNIKKAEWESPENMCYTSMHVWSGDSGVDRTTTTEAATV